MGSSEYLERAAANSALRRAERLAGLEARHREIARSEAMISRMVGNYKAAIGLRDERPLRVMQTKYMRLPAIMVNRDLLFHLEGPPPLARLIGRRAEAVTTFHVMQLARAAADSRYAPLTAITSISHRVGDAELAWPGLLGYPRDITQRAADLRLHRALDALSAAGLVVLPPVGTVNRYRKAFLAETGPARMPSNDDDRQMSVHLPVDFFANGWHLALTPPEVAVLLMMMDLRNAFSRRRRAVFVPRERRLARYGISDEVYRAHRELDEFQLLRFIDPVEHRRRGRTQPRDGEALLPFEFVVNRAAFERKGFEVVAGVLRRDTVAPHLTSTYQLRRKLPNAVITGDHGGRDTHGEVNVLPG